MVVGSDRLRALLYGLGAFIGRATPEDDLVALIAELRPVATEFELIRVGPRRDGGYLVPDDLDGLRYCFSPGVADEAGFEADLASRGMTVFMADASVDRPPLQHPEFTFRKKFVGAYDDDETISLDSWKDQTVSDFDGDLILQMDIEGAEYESLLAVSDRLLTQFRVMVVEFHHLDHLMNPLWYRLASLLFRRLLQTHAVVHIHPNNCCGAVRAGKVQIPRAAEFTFHRRDRFIESSAARSFPHPLDTNNTSGPALVLPRSWYRSELHS